MCARFVASPPPSLTVGAGKDDVRSVVMLALHLNQFDEERTVAALVDPTDVIQLLDMASRGCYHAGLKLPDIAASAVKPGVRGSGAIHYL